MPQSHYNVIYRDFDHSTQTVSERLLVFLGLNKEDICGGSDEAGCE